MSLFKTEIPPLTGIRGIAMIGIVFYHIWQQWGSCMPILGPVTPLIKHCNMGVDLFFILSGFIVSHAYSGKGEPLNLKGYLQFLWNRFCRIYPNHLTAILALVIMVCAFQIAHRELPDSNYRWIELPAQLTMTHLWWPTDQMSYWYMPSWAVSAEWFGYIFIFPLCIKLLHKEWSGNQFFILAAMTLAAFFIIKPHISWLVLGGRPYALPSFCAEFMAGSFCYAAYKKKAWILRITQAYTTWIGAAILVSMPFLDQISPRVILCLFPLLLMGLTSSETHVAKLLSTKWLLWLGRISYSIYMSHAFAFQITRLFIPTERLQFLSTEKHLFILFVTLLIMLFLAIGMYYLIEIPIGNRLRRLYRNKTEEPVLAINQTR